MILCNLTRLSIGQSSIAEYSLGRLASACARHTLLLKGRLMMQVMDTADAAAAGQRRNSSFLPAPRCSVTPVVVAAADAFDAVVSWC